jgi:hypothetical protein
MYKLYVVIYIHLLISRVVYNIYVTVRTRNPLKPDLTR